MATQREMDAGLGVLNAWIEENVTGFGSDIVKERFTEDLRYNLVLDIINATNEAVRQKKKPD